MPPLICDCIAQTLRALVCVIFSFLDTLDEDKLLKSGDIPVSDLLSGSEETELDHESDKGMLLQQLVHFAKGEDGMDSSLCVDGVFALCFILSIFGFNNSNGLVSSNFI